MTLTLYAASLRHLGLSQEDAGAVHARYGQAVRADTIASWSSGRREPPLGAFDDLRRYAAHIRAAIGKPDDIADALYRAENVSPSVADDLGIPSGNAMIVAIAARMLDDAV